MDWMAVALVAPLALTAAAAWPLSGANRWRHLLAHVAPLAAFLVLQPILLWGAESLAGDTPRVGTLGTTLQYYIAKKFAMNLLVYVGLVGFSQGVRFYHLFRDQQVEAALLETRLTRTRQQVLRAPLQPHFLYTTLHSISALMHRDVEAADRVVSRLGDLLRLSLAQSDQQEVTLREELEFLAHYQAIQETRFQDRLVVEMDVAPDTLELAVPSLILQPLVENAIRYGIEPRTGPGRIWIHASRRDARLLLQVSDDGPGLGAGTNGNGNGNGIGLANTRARLEQLYPDDHQFQLGRAPAGGLQVTIDLPARRLPDAARPADTT
jgi:LytS/YehU family sensor histidine kinase